MKKFGLFMTMVLVLLMASLSGCGAVSVNGDGSGTVIYDKYGVSFEDTLTAAEVKAVAEVLDGKSSEADLFGEPSCGFDEKVAIVVDGHRFLLACDQCGTVQDGSSRRYIHISDEERQVLEGIFASRGGTFPCI